MAAEKKPAKKGKGGAGGFLTRKEFGIPMWALILITAVLMFFAYRWYTNRSSKAASTTAGTSSTPDTTGVDTGDEGGGGDSGSGGGWSGSQQGGSGAGDLSGELSDIATELGSLGNQSSFHGQGYGGGGEINPEGTNPTATTPTAGSSGLVWGGQTFTTRSAFTAWLTAHGATLSSFETNHPAAYATFLGLAAGTPTKTVKKATKTTAAQGKATKIATKSGKAPVTPASVLANVKAGKAAVTGVSKAPTPKKLNLPLTVSGIVQTKAKSGAVKTAIQPSAAIKAQTTKTVAAKAPAHAVTTPAKSAAKPAPATKVVAVKAATPKPPTKAKK